MTEAEALTYFAELKTSYQLTFGKGDSLAFRNLAAFCHEHETCFVKGDRDQSLIMEGRRQVILRIRDFLNETPEQLVSIYATRPATGATRHDDQDIPQ